MDSLSDLHAHTVASTHAYSTVKEMAQAAAEAGLEFLAITDHAAGDTDGPHIWHFHNLHKAIPRELFGVKLLYGVEASIVGFDGRLSMPDSECAALDWVIASFHGSMMTPGTAEENTAAYIGVSENPLVDVIGHPVTHSFPYDREAVLSAFKENGKLFEINESTILWKNSEGLYRELLPICKRLELPVIINSDAHFFTAVGKFDNSLRILRELDFPERLVVNFDREKLLQRINRKKHIFD
ncbi:MAG: phosphatase [Ruminococcus sp.]|nr:phosphatase [Ruminococcus sp.]